MKAILLAGIILASSSLSSIAQTAATSQPSKAEKISQVYITQEAFQERINDYTAALSQGNEVGMNRFMALAAMMTRAASMNVQLMEKAEGNKKAQLKNLVDRQNRLYSEAKMMSGDGVKNKKEMEKKLQEFKATL